MECRPTCSVCCIYPSISSTIPGLRNGKPADVHCAQLNNNSSCKIFNLSYFPDIYADFKAKNVEILHQKLVR